MTHHSLPPDSDSGSPPVSTAETSPAEITEWENAPRDVVQFEDVTEISSFLDDDSLNDYPRCPHPLKRPLACLFWLARAALSIVALIALLAAIAAVPIASVFVLGYLLEVEGRVARTGKLRYGFPLLHRGQRIGTIAVGIGLWLLPVMFVSGWAADAALIDPDSVVAGRWQTAKMIVVPLVAAHLCLALARGGSLGCFFRPIRNLRWFLAEVRNRPHRKLIRCWSCGEPLRKTAEICPLCKQPTVEVDDESRSEAKVPLTYWERTDRKVREFIGDFRLKHHVLLGCRGFAGAFAVLLLPTLLYAAATSSQGPPVLVTLLGGLCLAVVFLYVPFLQAGVAAENRLSAMWKIRRTRRLFSHAPLAWFLALLAVYLLALPLYLFTIVLPPRDALWLITPIFVMSIYPARVITGWAYHRAVRKQREKAKPAWFGFRWGSRLLMLGTTIAYTLFFFFVRDIGSHGRLVLFEHHAFFGTVLSSLFSLLP